MDSYVCRICLQSGERTEEMKCIFEARSNQPSLQTKLHSLGFLQVYKEDGLPSHLCCWCAARVDDAFELKEQCAGSKGNLFYDSFLPVRKENFAAEEEEPGVLDLSLKSTQYGAEKTHNVPLSTTSLFPVSSMIRFTATMMTCLQKLSSSVRKLILIVNDALKFTMESSKLFFSFSLASHDKIHQFISDLENQAEHWSIRSASVEETISFVHLITLASDKNDCLKCSCDTSLAYVFPSGSNFSDSNDILDTSISSDTSGVGDLWSDTSLSMQSFSSNSDCNSSYAQNISNEKFPRENSSPTLDLLSTGPRKEVNKQNFSNRKLNVADILQPSVGDSSCKFALKSGDPSFLKSHCSVSFLQSKDTSGQSNSLSHCDSKSDKKLKRTEPCSSAPEQKRKKKKTENHANELCCWDVPIPLPPNPVPNKVNPSDEKVIPTSGCKVPEKKAGLFRCLDCGKYFTSTRRLENHIKSKGVCAVFPCTYCGKKYTTAWNRTQHERCHTGLNPYVCDVCGLSFRYNVSKRQHKARAHSVKCEPS